MLTSAFRRGGRKVAGVHFGKSRSLQFVNKSAKSWKSTITEKLTEQETPKAVGYWLLGMSGLVAGMVTVGGITRLTRSGLSMTDWKLQGTMPPMNQEEWEREFDRYKKFPEWQQRQSMTLSEFKYIFFWEWGHRMMGRFLGLAFTGPMLYFGARGMIPRSLYPRIALLFGLGGGQGLIGWWMVKSGLDKASIVGADQNKEIRVSPYRLATHLGMAFTTYVACLWTGLDILNPTKQTLQEVLKKNTGFKSHLLKGDSHVSTACLKHVQNIRGAVLINVALTAATVISGAYVAGNDAGRAYNTWPKMGNEWVPEDMYTLEPMWRNLVENTATVQFDHRILAMTTLASVSATFVSSRYGMGGMMWQRLLPAKAKVMLMLASNMVWAQVTLGISTLLLYVPIPLAATHQFGSLVLLTLNTAALHSLQFSRLLPVTKIAASATKGAPLSGVMLGATAFVKKIKK